MLRVQFILLILLQLSVPVCKAQDKLLLNNGKYRTLKGTVVFYDNNSILYQNEKQKLKLQAFEAKDDARQKALVASNKWQLKQQRKETKMQQNRERQLARIERRKAIYTDELQSKQNTLSPADFESWKNREEARIKQMEADIDLREALVKNAEEARNRRREALKRGRFTSEISRQRVFSIIREDGSEEIVYNADTLGILADGEPEVEYGVTEMRMYIKGRQDGRRHSFHDVYIGAGVGLASALLLTWTWDVFYAPIPPAICVAVIAGIRNFRPSPKLEIGSEFLNSEAYMDGYIRSARGRKALAFTIGAAGGLVVGSTAAVLTSPLLR
ncbi:MAG: hypothetical protein EP314_02080 [Bacteroidetes bacterium]|nr:MAG: hypothetical protein EP314_02080 [Bacteroidota bacterium]